MLDLRDLYQQVIIDHSRSPRNFGELPEANHRQEGYNPVCGDRLMIYLQEKNNIVQQARFTGEGCAISLASASLMIANCIGKSRAEIENLFSHFHDFMLGKPIDETVLGKLAILKGVVAFPMRVKCATLCGHTVLAALHDRGASVSTE